MNQRDVPGTTRAALPTLLENGIIGISVGVNGASTPPNVPPAFVWRDEASGAEVLALWHPFGYGGTGMADAVIIPGLSHALVFEWNGDNAGYMLLLLPPPPCDMCANFASTRCGAVQSSQRG
jgi:hypothetical protein